jgi:long-chain fatty acid transport protein
LTTGAAQWRVGYSYARDPIKRNLDPGRIGIGGNDPIGFPGNPSGTGGAAFPVNGNIIAHLRLLNS